MSVIAVIMVTVTLVNPAPAVLATPTVNPMQSAVQMLAESTSASVLKDTLKISTMLAFLTYSYAMKELALNTLLAYLTISLASATATAILDIKVTGLRNVYFLAIPAMSSTIAILTPNVLLLITRICVSAMKDSSEMVINALLNRTVKIYRICAISMLHVLSEVVDMHVNVIQVTMEMEVFVF